MKLEPGFEMEVPMWPTRTGDFPGGGASVRRLKKPQTFRQSHELYTCELDPDNPWDEGIMGTGRLFLLTAGSGGADTCGAGGGAGGRGTARFFFAGGTGPERRLRMTRATLSMSSRVVCMASAISSLVWDTKVGS